MNPFVWPAPIKSKLPGKMISLLHVSASDRIQQLTQAQESTARKMVAFHTYTVKGTGSVEIA